MQIAEPSGTMKTKVQAQRKFAQGAFIPPTVNIANVSIDRRIDVSPNKEKNIFHNRTSAKSLLDIVSFNNLHKHAQPIVLLERLEDLSSVTLGSKDQTSSALTIINKPSTSIVNKPNNESKQQGSSYNTRDATARQHKLSRTPTITPRLPMHLRSRVITYNDGNKALPYKKKNSIKDRKRVIASERRLRTKKRQQRAVEEFSNDDDQPLTFFRKKTLRARKDRNMRQRTLKSRPKSVKYSEPTRRIKERIERRILEVPDVITEIPESVLLAYGSDMDLSECDIRPGTATPYSAEPTTSHLNQNIVARTASVYKDPVPGTSTAYTYEDPVPSTTAASIYEDPVPGTSSSYYYRDPVPSTSSSYYYRDPVPSTSSYVEPAPSTLSHRATSSVYQDPVPGTSSNLYQNPVPGTSSNLYQDPVPGTSSNLYQDPVPGTSSNLYQDPVPGTSSNLYQDPVPGTSSNLYQDPVPGTSSNLYQDPVPGTSSNLYQDPVAGTSSNLYQDPVAGTSSNLYQDPVAGTSSLNENQVPDFQDAGGDAGFEVDESCEQKETTLLRMPPFYGIKEIDNWLSSDMNFVPTLSPVSTRKSPRNRIEHSLNTEIDLDICIASKLSSLSAISDYGPSFYDCLCLNCANCKYVHELLNQHKQNSLETMPEEEYLEILNGESVENANNNNVRTEEIGIESITIDDDDEIDIKTIDLTEDSSDLNIKQDSPAENVVLHELQAQYVVGHELHSQDVVWHELQEHDVVQHESQTQDVVWQELQGQDVVQHDLQTQDVIQPELQAQDDVQPGLQTQDVVQPDMPVQHDVPVPNVAQDSISEENDTPYEVSEHSDVQYAASKKKKSLPRRRRKRGRGRIVGGPVTRQKSQAAASDGAKRKRNEANDEVDPSLPDILQRADLINAPVFYPSREEFTDPMVYLEKVMPSAAQYGLFKVVSPDGFKPPCNMGDNARFTVSNQYIARLFNRWGPAAREMCTIRAYLASQKVFFSRAPLLDGLEVNLPKLFHSVQKLGGLKSVFHKKKWTRVAEMLKMRTVPNPEKKFDLLCLKYLLPYDTLTKRERQAIMIQVEQEWCKKSAKMLARVVNPLHQQKRLLGDSEASEDDQDEDDIYVQALSESEDCVVRGRNMSLGKFKKIADTALRMHFPPGDSPRTTAAIEDEYWKIVLLGTEHVSVNAAFIDTGPEGYGFTKNKNAAYGKHPWNLKMLSNNNKNVLRFLGLVSGVTIPSLHVGMVFSTSCWHRDPHGLPWIEYMHEGPDKIWYGVPEGQSSNFRIAAETLCPTSCQHKPIWLSSDIAMIPPNLLLDQNIRLSRVVQRPGEFIVVMPKAYSCSISTGFTISESVYFATNSFIKKAYSVFQELRESCEPSIFSLEQLLISMSKDPTTPRFMQHQVHGYLNTIVSQELIYRNALRDLRVPLQHVKRRVASWTLRDEEECQVCRTALYLSRVTGVLGKKSKLCQQHALRVLNDRQEDGTLDLTGIVLEVSMTSSELDEIILNLQKQLLSQS